MKILLVDDHELLGKSLEISFEKEPKIKEFTFVKSAEEAQKRILEGDYDIILLDINLKGESGLSLGESLIRGYPELKVIFLSGYNLPEYQRQAVNMGAFGYITKDISVDILLKKIEQVIINHQKVFDNHQQFEHIYESLTVSEKKLIKLISMGIKQTVIADELSIAEKTVRNKLYLINKKLNTQSTIETVTMAIKLGIIEL
ncbi:response regulator transcription factor [Ruoffia tabacinasalis]|uniref:Response regulator transcription factor n=1 Tax=Ruoffia tabacinasalis TaxID=87458 RepID=A0ABS0LGL0_9LACT|nr:response regulator transcription factor [Ruoffia tabacinasalis]MBG9977289.1 response regulator transcription factor [Ruoffia tabacinasalis]